MVKVLAMELYDVPETVPYLQVADSLVERDMVAWVVPADKAPVGEPELLTGGVVSATAKVFPEMTLDRVEIFEASSVALIAK